VSVKWSGLDELRAALRRLPADLTDEAQGIVDGAVDRAMAGMLAEYPEGELRDLLTRAPLSRGPFGVAWLVKNRSGWAWHWDHGTKLRHYTGKRGRRHDTGAEWGGKQAPHTFGRNAGQQRDRMYDELKALVASHGLLVSGEP
jgi:hypothetical protein